MKAPRFWQREHSFSAAALAPISWLYRGIVQHRARRKPDYVSHLPVICVGNATMGGSGKTPVVQSVAVMLNEAGHHPAILLRGYGGREQGPLAVTSRMEARDIGDEALLHAAIAPTIVARDRIQGAETIAINPAITHIVMDDGLQNPALKKSLSLLVIDGENPQGNGRIFPAGPLRESLEDAVRRSDAIILLGPDHEQIGARFRFSCPIFRATLTPRNLSVFQGKSVYGFAGIGRPEKFFASLETGGAFLAGCRAFPDHYPYAERDIARILLAAQDTGAIPVTTRKDWVRIPAASRSGIQVLDVHLMWEDEAAIRQFLNTRAVI